MTPREDHRTGRSPEHSVHLYEEPARLRESLARFVEEGVREGETVVLIVGPARLKSLRRRMPTRGHGILVDARALLRRILVGGRPDAARLAAEFRALLARIGDGPFRVFGEAVDLLCRDGAFGAAVELEELWNGLRRDRPFALF